MNKSSRIHILKSLLLTLLSGWTLGFSIASRFTGLPSEAPGSGLVSQYLEIRGPAVLVTLILLISWLWIPLRRSRLYRDDYIQALRKDAYRCAILLLLLPLSGLGVHYGWSVHVRLLLVQIVLGSSIILRLSGLQEVSPLRSGHRKQFLVLAMAIILFSFVTARFAFCRHDRFHTFAFDMGMVSNVVWNLSRGDLFLTSLFPWPILGEHLSPVYLFYAPLYWLWPNPKILIAVQSILLSAASVPLYLLGGHLLKNRISALFIALSYLLFPGLRGVAFTEVHEVAFFPLFFFAALYCFYGERPRWQFFLFWILAMCCKEDTCLLMAGVGLVISFHEKSPRTGLVVVLGSVVWFLLAVKVLIPAFRGGEYSYTIRYAEMGGSFSGVFRTVLSKPIYTLSFVFDENHRPLLFHAFGSFLLLPLLSFPALFIALVPLASSLLSSEHTQSLLLSQYPAVWLPGLIFAVLLAVRNVCRWNWTKGRVQPLALASAILVVALFLPTVSKVPPWSTVVNSSRWGMIYPVLSFNDDAHSVLDRFSDPDASVSAQTIFVPHLAARRHIYQFPEGDADYLFVDISPESNKWPLWEEEMRNLLLRLVSEQQYGVFDHSGTVYLLKKGVPETEATARLVERLSVHPAP